MNVIILNSRSRFRKLDLNILDKAGAIFYETENQSLLSIPEISNKQDCVLAIQPGYIKGCWNAPELNQLVNNPHIKGVCLSTTAFGWVPYKDFGNKSIPVCNVPGKSTDAVAEYYAMLMIALLRRLPLAIKAGWLTDKAMEVKGSNAKGKKVGIVGMGSIGQKFAKICNGLEMEIVYWNRSNKDLPYKSTSLTKLFSDCDVIFLSLAVDDSNINLIDHQILDSMKSTAILLSAVDSRISEYEYIIQKVKNETLGGFAWEAEGKTLMEYQGNVFPAPEIAYFTNETLENESRIITESVMGIVNGKPINVVNL